MEMALQVVTKVEEAIARSSGPARTAGVEWDKDLSALVEGVLFHSTDNSSNSANIPGKRKEIIGYITGIDQ